MAKIKVKFDNQDIDESKINPKLLKRFKTSLAQLSENLKNIGLDEDVQINFVIDDSNKPVNK